MSNLSRQKPVLVFDGDCDFCKMWIARWKDLTGDRIDYAPFQEVASEFPFIPEESFRRSVQLIDPSGHAVAGAHAVFHSLALAGEQRWLLWAYRHIPGFSLLSERAYRKVADHRNLLYKVTRLLWGPSVRKQPYVLTRSLFLRGMGAIYAVAFLSLSTQILGLIGSRGILPAQGFLEAVRSEIGGEAYRMLPTLAWLDASDGFLQFLCVAGVALSVLLIIGVLPKITAFLLWLLYFSLYSVGQTFLSFQWDVLLLETGFLTIMFAPLQLLAARSSTVKLPSIAVLWLLRFLLFRLMFQSGFVKLASGDPSWTNLTALTFHYESECIPTPVAWYAQQLPLWFQQLSVVMMFIFELVVPFLIFTPRRLRMLGGLLLIAFQLLIALTGNYGFFNILTIVLCFTLFDDAAIRHGLLRKRGGEASRTRISRSTVRRILLAAFVAAMVILNLIHLSSLFIEYSEMPDAVASLYRWSTRYRIVNSYGLFRVMTRFRPEIVIEGSNDGAHWSAYEFKYKAGDTLRAPPWVAPHQPRLDWQMWFAALGSYTENRWFVNFMVRLLEGSGDVLALLERNPFPDAPPRYIRALEYRYNFTDFKQRRATGAYWRREYKGLYLPAISLRRN